MIVYGLAARSVSACRQHVGRTGAWCTVTFRSIWYRTRGWSTLAKRPRRWRNSSCVWMTVCRAVLRESPGLRAPSFWSTYPATWPAGPPNLFPIRNGDPVGQSDGCDGCVGAHMDALRGCSQSHWHRCPNGRLCAVIPLVWDGICVAACRIVCPGTLPESTFQRHIELVEVVVENFVATESDLLRRLMSPPSQEAQVGKPPAITPTEARALADHPRVIEALDYIDRHVTRIGNDRSKHCGPRWTSTRPTWPTSSPVRWAFG